MADETWYRHANPISGLTRIFSLPLVVLPIWFMQEFFRDPLGFWYPPAALAAVGLWAWLNPRIFPKPTSFDSYLSRGVLGEKLWSELPKKLDVPMILTILQVPFAIGMVYFTFFKEFWAMMFFTSMAFVVKMWFVDRVVQLYDSYVEKRLVEKPP